MTCPPHDPPGHLDCQAAGRDSKPGMDGETVGRNGGRKSGESNEVTMGGKDGKGR